MILRLNHVWKMIQIDWDYLGKLNLQIKKNSRFRNISIIFVSKIFVSNRINNKKDYCSIRIFVAS